VSNHPKLNINKLSIWTVSGQPRCSPGSLEDAANQVRQFIDVAEIWLSAVEDIQAAQKQSQLTPEQEKEVQRIMKKVRCSRRLAVDWVRHPLDASELIE
jgi:hypothetical protein